MAEQSQQKGNKFDLQILRRLMQFAKPYKMQFYGLVAIIFISAALSPTIPFLIQITIDEHIAVKDYDGTLTLVLIMLGILVVQSITAFLNTYWSGWLGQSIIRDIRIKLFRKILKLKLKFFDVTPIGRLVTRNVSDVETLAEVFSQGIAALLSELLQLVLILGMMFFVNWRLTLVILSTMPFLLVSTYIFKEKVKGSFNEVRNAVSNLNTFVQERITGMNIVQIFGKEKREQAGFEKINKEHLKANLKSVKYYSIYFPVAEVISAIGVGLIVWYGGRGILQGYISGGPGELISFIMYLNMFFRPIRLIADRFNTLQMGVVSTDRLIKLLDSDEFIADNGTVEAKDIHGHVEFEDVKFEYKEGEPVLRDISFEVKQGQTVAFVGATGAGKTSIINLLNRFYEIQGGVIKVDGVDVKDYKVESLRSRIGMVLQDVFLFSDSIRENIRLGNKDITDEEILKAADLVGARKFIEKLPNGLDYKVQERGASLSVGQRQLVSFVRAMVYDPAIMVLDEATSSVDGETEELIQEAISKLMHGRTSIVIAHRLSTIQKADKIIVLEKGEVVEQGTHDELISRDGYYKELHDMQYQRVEENAEVESNES